MSSFASRERRRFTPEEYLTLERGASYPSEYVDGEIFSMAGGTFEHDTITSNIGGLLYTQLRGTKCQVLTSNMKVRTRSSGLYSYPDVTVVCDKPEFHDSKRDVLINPRVLIEVLSPSTEAFDKGEKRLLYQTIDSLQEYVLVAQDRPWVEHWSRRRDDQWLVSSLKTMNVELNLTSINCSLRLEEIYERVEFSQ